MTVASSSHDKSIRLWEKCEEILVLEEEKEQQREKEFDAEIEQEENPVVSLRELELKSRSTKHTELLRS